MGSQNLHSIPGHKLLFVLSTPTAMLDSTTTPNLKLFKPKVLLDDSASVKPRSAEARWTVR